MKNTHILAKRRDETGAPDSVCPCCCGALVSIKDRVFTHDFVRCLGCRGVFSTVVRHEEVDYLARAAVDVEARMKLSRKMFDEIEEVICGERIVDVGCSAGDMLVEAARRGYRDIYGVDVVTKAAQVARDRVGRGVYLVGDYASVILPRDHFDVAVFRNVLMYSADLGKWLRKTRECLRPGGIVYVCERSERDLVSRIKLNPSSKMNVFVAESIRCLLERYDFEVVTCRTSSGLRGDHMSVWFPNRFRRIAARVLGLTYIDRLMSAEMSIVAIGRKREDA